MFQYTPYILPLVIPVIILIPLIWYGYLQRKHKIAVYFALTMGAILIWVGFAMLETLAVPLDLRLFFVNIDFIGLTYVAPLLLLMTLEHLGKTHQSRYWIRASFVVPTLTNIVIWTNGWHGLWYGNPSLDTESAPFVLTLYDYGEWYYFVHLPYSWLILVSILILLLSNISLKKSVYRHQTIIFLVALLLPVIVDILYRFGITPIPQFNFSHVMFSISGIILAWSLYRYRFLDLVPIARDIIFQNIKDMMLVTDLQQRIVDVNMITDQFTDKRAHELIGLSIHSIFPKHSDIIDKYLEADELENEFSFEDITTSKYFNVEISPLKQANHLIGHLLIIRDISTQKALVEREKQLALEQLRSKLQYQLITHVTHDLITPITVIKSSLHVARKTKDDKKRQEKLDIIDGHIERLQGMLQDMLFMSKIDMASDLAFEDIRLQQFFKNLLASYQQTILAKKQTLTLDICDNDVFIKVNSEYLIIALSHILDNALEYTPENGHIEVTIECDAHQLMISIKDNGIGIASDELKTIFDRFHRSAIHRPTNAGSGLGLSIAQRVITLHHGTISVQSELGEGSTFEIIIPMISSQQDII